MTTAIFVVGYMIARSLGHPSFDTGYVALIVGLFIIYDLLKLFPRR